MLVFLGQINILCLWHFYSFQEHVRMILLRDPHVIFFWLKGFQFLTDRLINIKSENVGGLHVKFFFWIASLCVLLSRRVSVLFFLYWLFTKLQALLLARLGNKELECELIWSILYYLNISLCPDSCNSLPVAWDGGGINITHPRPIRFRFGI